MQGSQPDRFLNVLRFYKERAACRFFGFDKRAVGNPQLFVHASQAFGLQGGASVKDYPVALVEFLQVGLAFTHDSIDLGFLGI
nr:hypothetical protein [Methylobacter luteus]